MVSPKTITANGSKGHHRFSLRVTEDSISNNSSFVGYSFTISAIQSGWDWANWGSQISYSIIIGDNTYTGTIPSYNGSSTVTLKSGSNIEIPHNSDGTKTINISFTVTDTTGQSYTCGNASASDTFKLSDLHKAPNITNMAIVTERNGSLVDLGLTNTIVQHLSLKTIKITASTYDSATIQLYEILHNNAVVGLSSSDTVPCMFGSFGELQGTTIGGALYVELVARVTDNKGGISTKTFTFPFIKYTQPTIEKTSTSIKRKTDNQTSLIDNVAILNFVGTVYKGNDALGNANTQQVKYKIWKVTDTEPAYTNISSSTSGSGDVKNVTITNYQINNISYTNVWNYKIKIQDAFTSYDTTEYVKTDKVPTGVSVWSEYKDRVNFLEITIGNKYFSNIGDTIKAYCSQDQSVSRATDTIVNINTIDYNTSNKLTLSNNAIYIGENVHTILINCRWTAWSADNHARYIYVYKNGNIVAFNNRAYSATMETSVVVPVEEGDYIDMRCYQEQTGSITINSNKEQTFIQATILN